MANNLNDLLSSNSEVRAYFNSLPSSVQNSVCESGEDISSLDDLLRAIKTCGGGTTL